DRAGNLYIAESYRSRVVKVTPEGKIFKVAGGALGDGGDGGPATAAQMRFPIGLMMDAAGNLYIADSGTHRIRKLTASTSIITTLACTGVQAYSGDGGPAMAAALNSPSGMDLDSAGNLYIADNGNNLIRKVTPDGIIHTIAGIPNLPPAFSGDGGPATAA